MLANGFITHQFSSVRSLSFVWFFSTPWTAAHQASLSITTSTACSNACPSSQWCHQIILSSAVPFSSCLQSFPVSGSFPVSQSFPSGGRSIGASASASILPMNIQDLFPLGLTGLISLQSKSLLQQHNSKASTLALNFLYSTTLSSIHNYWKNHSFD